MKILIVENSKRTREALEAALQARAETFSVCSGNQAIAYLREFHEDIDVVLTDYHMHDGSGMDVINHIQGEGYDTPVVLLTAYGSKSLSIEALHKRVFRFLEKPVDLGRLLEVIDELEHLLSEKRQEQRIRKLGLLSQIVFHEIGHPLQSLLNETQKLGNFGIDRSENSEYIEPFSVFKEHVLSLVETFNGLKSLLIFDRLDQAEFEEIEVEAVIFCLDEFFKDSIRKHDTGIDYEVRSTFLSEPRAPIRKVVKINKPLVMRAMGNLAQNAIDAVIDLSVDGSRRESSRIRLDYRLTEANLEIEIRNSFAASVQTSAKVPNGYAIGLTSKPQPHMGLGLYIANKIIEKHGGSVCLELGADAVTRISFPLEQ